jgi:cytochrome c1
MKRRILNLLLLMIAGIAIATIGRAGEAPDLSGAELYQTFCSSCHGVAAHGDGLVASTFRIAVPDLTSISMRHFGEFPTAEVFRVIDGRKVVGAHGSREMPVWGREFYAYDGVDPIRRQRANEMIARLVEYLRSIQAGEIK